jgi:hypothetical protein
VSAARVNRALVRGPFGRGGAGVCAALALATLCVQGCGDKKSLVLVSLTASPADANLTTLVLTVGSVAPKTFTHVSGLSGTPLVVGVYVPSSVTGDVLVVAAASAGSSAECYQGSAHVSIASAGVTTEAVPIELTPSQSCPAPTGAAGSSGMGSAGTSGAQGSAGSIGTAGAQGAAGTQGSAGAQGTAGTMGTAGQDGGAAGTQGTAGTMMGTAGQDGGTDAPPVLVDPPSLTKCTEYDHIVDPPCKEGDPNDWRVSSVAFSPDGKLLLSAGEDSRVKVWTMNGAVPTAEGHVLSTSGQGYMAFSADGKLFAIGSGNGQLTVHNPTTWAVMSSPTGQTGHVEGVGFSPDGKQLFAADTDGILTVHNVGTDAPTKTVKLPVGAYALTVSPVQTSTALWVGVGYSNGFADLLNFASATVTPTMALTITSDAGTDLANATLAGTFSPDGKTFAAGGEDGITSFWTVPPPPSPRPVGTAITSMDANGNPLGSNGMTFSPDGRFFAQAVGTNFDGGDVGIWDATSRGARGTKVPTYYPLSVAFSPDGKSIAAGEVACGKIIICAD